MNRFRIVAILFVSTSIVPYVAFAHVSFKDEGTSVAATTPHNWTGYYAGLNAGVVQQTMKITDTQATTFYSTLNQVTNPSLTGGLQIGYRRQLDLTKVSGVFGAEFSANFSNATFSQQYGSAFATYKLNSQHDLENVCLLQLTGGIAADKTLLFLAAGLSWANISGTTTNVDTVPFFNSFNVSKKALGTAWGGGIEYAFTREISARLKIDVVIPNSYSTLDNTGNSFEVSNTIVQSTLGVNYKFA